LKLLRCDLDCTEQWRAAMQRVVLQAAHPGTFLLLHFVRQGWRQIYLAGTLNDVAIFDAEKMKQAGRITFALGIW